MVVGAPQDLEEFGASGKGVPGGQVAGEQLENGLQEERFVVVDVPVLGRRFEDVVAVGAGRPGFFGGPQEWAADGAVLGGGRSQAGVEQECGSAVVVQFGEHGEELVVLGCGGGMGQGRASIVGDGAVPGHSSAAERQPWSPGAVPASWRAGC
jgi:hypothetical protein